MRYIILLRGINVGGRNLKMAEVKACFEKAGYKNVLTVLQTGNVILESKEKSKDKLCRHVEKILSDAFGYPAKVLVIEPFRLKEIIKDYPFGNKTPEYHRYAFFTEKGFEKELAEQAGPLDESLESVRPGMDVVYWRAMKGHTLDSRFGKYIGKAATKHFLTTRNLNTLEKILAKSE